MGPFSLFDMKIMAAQMHWVLNSGLLGDRTLVVSQNMEKVWTDGHRRYIPRGGQIEVACQGGISPLGRLLGMAGGDLSPCTAALNIRMSFNVSELACISTRKGNAFHMPPSLHRPPAKMPPTQARMPARPAQLTIPGIRSKLAVRMMCPTVLGLHSIFLSLSRRRVI